MWKRLAILCIKRMDAIFVTLGLRHKLNPSQPLGSCKCSYRVNHEIMLTWTLELLYLYLLQKDNNDLNDKGPGAGECVALYIN